MQNNTTHSSAWVQPLTTTYGTSYFKNVTASADGTATTTNITFPRTKIKAVYPAEQYAGYTGLLMVDDQDRMWYSGYFYYNYGYQANTTSLTTLSLAFPYPSPWNHNLSSGSKFAGNSQVTIEDIYCQKSVGTTVYHNYFLRDSAGGIWYHGEQYHNMGGAGATGPKVHWARLGTS